MSGETMLLAMAADHIEEYCEDITDCEECKLKSLCDMLEQEPGLSYTIGERIRKAAEE